MRNKRGVNLILSNIIFLIINVLFLSGLLVAVSVTGDDAILYEEAYAKQIGLMIDQAKVGTKIEINVDELLAKADENHEILQVRLDCERNKVIVKASKNSQYEFEYFNKLQNCNYDLDLQKRRFTINV